MTPHRPPLQMFELGLTLSADTWDQLVAQLEQIATDVGDRAPGPIDKTSGGGGTGYSLQVAVHPEQTPEVFAAELSAWHAEFVARRDVALGPQRHTDLSISSVAADAGDGSPPPPPAAGASMISRQPLAGGRITNVTIDEVGIHSRAVMNAALESAQRLSMQREAGL